jgi:RNA polymerase sigma factor (sigma-70 family)
MAKPRWGNALRGVHSLLEEGVMAAVADGDLLRRYAMGGCDSAERAFTALVDRHGSMVLRVCRNVLRDAHAAEDAFQATFLVLARKAGSLWVHDSIGPWLHAVAFRTSCCARNAAARRRRHERKAADRASRQAEAEEADDLGAILHLEIGRLPERYRAAVVLCYLEGLTHEQAAERLGCPVGTVRSRLATGRERLRRRLILRGLSPARGELEPAMDRADSTIVAPAALTEAAVRNAMVHAGASTAGVVPAGVSALAAQGMRTMLFARLRTLAVALILVGGSTVAALAFAQRQQEPAKPDQPTAHEVASSSLPRPIRSLLEARIETAREIIKRDLDRLQLDPSHSEHLFHQMAIWSRHVMEDRLRLARTPEERLDAIREHRNRMIVHEGSARRQYEFARVSSLAESLKFKYYRLEADQLLAEAGVDPDKEPPPAEPEKATAPPASAPPRPVPQR